MNVLPALMLVTLMPSVKILLDLTLVPAKRVLQEMENHALVRFTCNRLTNSSQIKTIAYFFSSSEMVNDIA